VVPRPAELPPVPSVDAEPDPDLPLPAAEPPVPTEELLVPFPAEVPPVPSVEAEPEPLPAAEPAVPTDELLVPLPAEVPPVPSVEAEPVPEPPAEVPPVPTDELEVPPPADVPPVPMVELDCARARAAVPARKVAVSAASDRRFMFVSLVVSPTRFCVTPADLNRTHGQWRRSTFGGAKLSRECTKECAGILARTTATHCSC